MMPKQKDLRKAAGMPASRAVKPAPSRSPKVPEGFEPVQRGAIHKWEAEHVVRGEFLRLRQIGTPEKPSTLVDFRVDGRRLTYGAPAVLRDYLMDLAAETPIYVRCLGKVLPTKQGDAWDFSVYVSANVRDDGEPF